MLTHRFVGIVANDSTDATLAAVVSTVKGCRSRIVAHWPRKNPQLSETFLILGHVDFNDERDLQRVMSFLSQIKSAEKYPRVVLVASNVADDADSIKKQKQLLEWGALEIMERPLNLQRLRYVIESQKIHFEFWKKQNVDADKSGDPSDARDKLTSQLKKISTVNTNVLLSGETGVGKTFWAEHVHQNSARAKQPFVVVNCANFTATLVESQLFGHVKGAFTGADRTQPGQFEHAGQGTIFLDEVDSLSTEIQAKLLRVVENREFRRLGENKPIPMKARIISATNSDLDSLIAEGKFRADLFYRLNAYEIQIPPLRERRSEIESLSHLFAEEFAAENGTAKKSFDQDVLKMLLDYPWPGNLRELRNCVQHGAIDADNSVIRLQNLPQKVREHFQAQQAANTNEPAIIPKVVDGNPIERTDFHEVRRLVEALEHNDYNRSKTAQELGVSRMTVYNMLKRHQLG